jgi:hypothetical protein
MSYQTGTATSQQDFLNKMLTFLTANGWTQDDWDTVNKELAFHITSPASVYISMRWDATATTGGISIHQALGYTGGNTPGNHPNDSGTGQKAGTPITTGRRLDRIGNGPFTNHYFFTDGPSPTYAHVVLEYAPGLYRHMSFGKLVKFGDWTGGEYACGHVWDSSTFAKDTPKATSHHIPFDATNNQVYAHADTIHAEGLPNHPANPNDRWLVSWAGEIGMTNDGDGNARGYAIGGARDGFLQNALGPYRANPNNGYVPLIPVQVWYREDFVTPDGWRLLGYAPDIRVINIGNMEAGDEFTVGSDTWKVFPWVRKQYLQNDTDESWNAGFAYKK